MTRTTPVVTVIIPCRREREWIGACLEAIVEGSYPRELLEVLVVDGMSEDGTREVVERYAERFACIRLIDNPALTAPAAMNLGIRRAQGDIVIRMDAHTMYPRDYIASLLEWLERTGADNVGGVVVTVPANERARAKGIAAALAHPFGVGNSRFRIGSRAPMLVDTVPFGCYRRTVFERIGLFDEELVRNQDDEFNARLRRVGGQILLVPSITCRYVGRASLGAVFRMQYQYGYYKPLAAAKVGQLYTVRQLVPPAFVGAIAVLAVLATFVSVARLALVCLTALYAIGLAASAFTAPGTLGVRARLWMCVAFAAIHVGYGSGYLAGIPSIWIRRKAASGAPAGHTAPLTR